MNGETLLLGLTDVRDRYLAETEARLLAEKKHRRRAGACLLAAALVVLLCFGTALAVDTDFRQRVFALFTLEDAPPVENGVTGTEAELGEGVTAEYIFVPHFARTQGGMFLVCADEEELRQGSRYDAYAFENGELVPRESRSFDQVYTVGEQRYHLRFEWASEQGNVAFTWVPDLGEQSLEAQGEWHLYGGTETRCRVDFDGAYQWLDLTTGAVTPAEAQEYWQTYSPGGEQIVCGNRLSLEREADGTFTLADMAAGARVPLEGYELPEASRDDIFQAENPSGTALLLGVRGGADWNYTTLDVVTAEKCIRIRHESAPGVKERYLQWLDDTRFVIDCAAEDGQEAEGTWFYFYDIAE